MGWRSGQSYSQDLRDGVLGAVDGGAAARQVAATFGVSIAYIYRALIRRRLTGDAGINPNRGHAPRKLSGEQELALAAHMRSRPGLTLAQAQAWLLAEHGVEPRPWFARVADQRPHVAAAGGREGWRRVRIADVGGQFAEQWRDRSVDRLRKVRGATYPAHGQIYRLILSAARGPTPDQPRTASTLQADTQNDLHPSFPN